MTTTAQTLFIFTVFFLVAFLGKSISVADSVENNGELETVPVEEEEIRGEEDEPEKVKRTVINILKTSEHRHHSHRSSHSTRRSHSIRTKHWSSNHHEHVQRNEQTHPGQLEYEDRWKQLNDQEQRRRLDPNFIRSIDDKNRQLQQLEEYEVRIRKEEYEIEQHKKEYEKLKVYIEQVNEQATANQQQQDYYDKLQKMKEYEKLIERELNAISKQWEKYEILKQRVYQKTQHSNFPQWENIIDSNENEGGQLNGQTNSGQVDIEDLLKQLDEEERQEGDDTLLLRGQDAKQLHQQLKKYEVRIRKAEYEIEQHKKEYEKLKVYIERQNNKPISKQQQKVYYDRLQKMKEYEKLIERKLNAISKQREKYEILKQLVYQKTQHSKFPQWENIIDSNENEGGQLNGQTNSGQVDIEDLRKQLDEEERQEGDDTLLLLGQDEKQLHQQLKKYEVRIRKAEYEIEQHKKEYEKLKVYIERQNNKPISKQQQKVYYDRLQKMKEYEKLIERKLNAISKQREKYEILKQLVYQKTQHSKFPQWENIIDSNENEGGQLNGQTNSGQVDIEDLRKQLDEEERQEGDDTLLLLGQDEKQLHQQLKKYEVRIRKAEYEIEQHKKEYEKLKVYIERQNNKPISKQQQKVYYDRLQKMKEYEKLIERKLNAISKQREKYEILKQLVYQKTQHSNFPQWENIIDSNENEGGQLNGQTNSGQVDIEDLLKQLDEEERQEGDDTLLLLGQDEKQLHQQLKKYEVRIRKAEYEIEQHKKEYEKLKVYIERQNNKPISKQQQKVYYDRLQKMKEYEKLIERKLNAISKQREKYEILKQLVYQKTQHSKFPQWENIIDSNENEGGQLNGQTNSGQVDIEDLRKQLDEEERQEGDDTLLLRGQDAKQLHQQLKKYEVRIRKAEYEIEQHKKEYEKLKVYIERQNNKPISKQQQKVYYDRLQKMKEYEKLIERKLNAISKQREKYEILKQLVYQKTQHSKFPQWENIIDSNENEGGQLNGQTNSGQVDIEDLRKQLDEEERQEGDDTLLLLGQDEKQLHQQLKKYEVRIRKAEYEIEQHKKEYEKLKVYIERQNNKPISKQQQKVYYDRLQKMKEYEKLIERKLNAISKQREKYEILKQLVYQKTQHSNFPQWENIIDSNENEGGQLNGQTNSGQVDIEDLRKQLDEEERQEGDDTLLLLGQDEKQLHQQLKKYEVRIRKAEYEIEQHKKEYEKLKVYIERQNNKPISKQQQKVYYDRLQKMKEYEKLIERKLNAISKQREKYEILKQLVYQKTQHSKFPQWENIIDSNENEGGQLNGQTNSGQVDIEDLLKQLDEEERQEGDDTLLLLGQDEKQLHQQLKKYEVRIKEEGYKIEQHTKKYEKLKLNIERLKKQATANQQQKDYYERLKKMEEYKKQIAREINVIRKQREEYKKNLKRLVKHERELKWRTKSHHTGKETKPNYRQEEDKYYVINSSEEHRTLDFPRPPLNGRIGNCRIVCEQK